jgi:hypothetical protein
MKPQEGQYRPGNAVEARTAGRSRSTDRALSDPLGRRMMREAVLLAGLTGCLMSTACGSSSPAPTTRRPATSHFLSPARVTALALGPRQGVVSVRRGTLVRSSDLSVRVFVDARHGFALADLRNGETYPAATVDGGKRWRIDGPVFHIPAANGAAVVTQVGAVRPNSYFAFGGGSVVDATTDAGHHWWVASLGENVLLVVPGTSPHHLIAVSQIFLGKNSTRVAEVLYLSRDGGRHWDRTDHAAY